MSRPTMATMKALVEQRDSLMTAFNKAVEEHREALDARDARIETLEDERDSARRNAARLQAALDALAEDEMRARLRFDAAIYAMVLMQRETQALRDARPGSATPRAHSSGWTLENNKWVSKQSVWDGKEWVALAT